MLKDVEKPDFMNTRAVRVCQKVMSVSDRNQKEPYIYVILRNTGHGIDFS